MKYFLTLLTLLLCVVGTNAQQSPFGTGSINDQLLGPLDDLTVTFSSNAAAGSFFDNYNVQDILSTNTYDLYIPADYDSSEAYGIVLFINSGNNGGFKTQWNSVMDDRKLIWVAADNVGNAINVGIRMSYTWFALYRMQELFNIDTDRIYTSGNSGGARSVTQLTFFYPEWIDGSLPLCGASFVDSVAQDYETQQPNGHYEALSNFSDVEQDYIRSYGQRYAIMTSYDDFREGDIMNIYHNGMELEGFDGKFLETSGGHCATTTQHFLDALNFVEHPFLPVIDNQFNTTTPAVGNAFTYQNADVNVGAGTIAISPVANSIGQAKARDLFRWNDPMGAIIETNWEYLPASANNNIVHLGIWEYRGDTMYQLKQGKQLEQELGILLTIDNTTPDPVVTINVNDSANLGTPIIIYQNTMTDYVASEPVRVKYHLWDNELRVEFSNHFKALGGTANGVRLLDDLRSVQITWPAVNGGLYNPSDWANGAYLTLAVQAGDTTIPASILLKNASIISADTLALASLLPAPIDTTGPIDTTTPNSIVEHLVEISVIPNPTNGKVKLQYPAGNYSMYLIDPQGKEVLTTSLSGMETSLDVSQISSGIYIGKMISEVGEVFWFRLVKSE